MKFTAVVEYELEAKDIATALSFFKDFVESTRVSQRDHIAYKQSLEIEGFRIRSITDVAEPEPVA